MAASEPVIFQGPVGQLEGLLDRPVDTPRAIAVVCHPHPLQQGAMTNKVTYILARAFNDLGAVNLRFNFRGVGQSAGSFDNGVGETSDALSAMDWLSAKYPGSPLWLGGFSFGAYIALRAQSERAIKRLVTVAPAVERFDTVSIKPPECPWLLVQGDADEVVAPQAVLAWANKFAQPPSLVIMKGAGHFFHGRLNDIRQAVVDYFVSHPGT
jgi:uncharacterized protein